MSLKREYKIYHLHRENFTTQKHQKVLYNTVRCCGFFLVVVFLIWRVKINSAIFLLPSFVLYNKTAIPLYQNCGFLRRRRDKSNLLGRAERQVVRNKIKIKILFTTCGEFSPSHISKQKRTPIGVRFCLAISCNFDTKSFYNAVICIPIINLIL